MKTKTKSRMRLYSKDQPRFPKPKSAKKDKGFALRLIQNADSRFAVVKQLRRRLQTLMEDAGVDSFQREALAGRAVFLLAHVETMEVDALDGTPIDWKRYLQSVKLLGDVLGKLGLDREAKSAKRLSDYIEEHRGERHRKHR